MTDLVNGFNRQVITGIKTLDFQAHSKMLNPFFFTNQQTAGITGIPLVVPSRIRLPPIPMRGSLRKLCHACSLLACTRYTAAACSGARAAVARGEMTHHVMTRACARARILLACVRACAFYEGSVITDSGSRQTSVVLQTSI